MRHIPGLSIRVARDGNQLLAHDLGVGDLASGARLTPTHRFRLGCLTKPIVAHALLQLAAQGRLDLDDAAARHIPALATSTLLRNITIGHLLSHTSGLARGPYAASLASDVHTLRHIGAAKLLFAPGAHFKYSNWGYYLLGKVLESVSGESTAACISKLVLSPLGMRHSGFSQSDHKLASGYWNGWYFGCPDLAEPSVPSPHIPLPDAAGGMISTADDYLRWLSDGIGASGGQMLVPRHRVGRNYSACFGLFVETVDAMPVYYFAGSSSGYSSFMLLIPALGLAGVAFCNHGACTNELREILYRACRKTVAALPRFGHAGGSHDVLAGNRRSLLRFCAGAGQGAQLIRDEQPIALWRHSRSAYFMRDGAGRRQMLRISGVGSGDAVLTLGQEVFYERLSRLRKAPAAQAPWQELAGVYCHAVFGKVELICRERQLYLSYGAAYESLLEPAGGLRFRQAPGAFCFEDIEFQTDPGTGVVASFLLNDMLFARSPAHEKNA